MKISIVTACYNAASTIRDAMSSVLRQKVRAELEYIVVDGGSTDGTVEIVREFGEKIGKSGGGGERLSFRSVSESDRGLYDALNKGIRMATGDIVGICNADDVFASDDVLQRLADGFDTETDLVYADVRFVRSPSAASGADSLAVLRAAPTTRYCTGRFFRRWMFRFATFPAHPSTFVRREWFGRTGGYSLDYRISADFELMLRLFLTHRVRAKYVPVCTHVMRAGGMSTDGVRSNVEINREDLRALRANGYWSCLPLIYLKYPFKACGILFRQFHRSTKGSRQ